MTCREVEDNLVAYVDGVANANPAIATHLETCAACRESAHAQRVAREVLHARRAQLSPIAPPGLRTRIAANLDEHRKTARPQDLKSAVLLFLVVSVFNAQRSADVIDPVLIRCRVIAARSFIADRLR